MSDSAAQGDAPRARKKSRTKVKVVASRYAQALQKKNERGNLQTAASAGTTDKSHGRGGTQTKGEAAVASASNLLPACRPVPVISSTTQSAPKGPASASYHYTDDSLITHATPAAPSDIRARLEAYRASKKQPAASGSSVGKPRAASIAKKVDAAQTLRSKSRPTFPRRITTPVDRASKWTTKVASTPRQVETILSRPRSAGTSAANSKSSSSSSGHRTTREDTKTPRCATARTNMPVTAPPSEAEELELLQSLYYQLSLAEAKAEDSFRRQEQRAEKQLLAAWGILQSKLQQLQDATLRLDREKHVNLLDDSLHGQAEPVAQVAERLPELMRAASVVSDSLEAALDRLPTPGIVCDAPAELKRHLESLTTELDALLTRLRTTYLGESISCAVAFEREMQQHMDKFNAALLQAAHLLGELQGEVDSETSMTIQKIQQQRLASGS